MAGKARRRTVRMYMCRKVICAQVLKVGARPRSVRDRRGVIIIIIKLVIDGRLGGLYNYLHTTIPCLHPGLRRPHPWVRRRPFPCVGGCCSRPAWRIL